MRPRFFTLFSVCAIVLVSLAGCQFLTGSGDVEQGVTGSKAAVGTARVAFRIVTTRNPQEAPTAAIRAAGTTVRVTFRLSIIDPGAQQPVVILTKTADVGENGVSHVSFAGVPARTVLGEFEIVGGTIGGKSQFHGAADLTPGDNILDVSPKGTLLPADIVANVVRSVANDLDLVRRVPTALATRVTTTLNTTGGTPDSSTYGKLLDAFVTTNVTGSDIVTVAAADNGTRLQASGKQTWSVLGTTIWTGESDAAQMRVARVIRQSFGDTLDVAWEVTNGRFGVSRLNAETGAVVAKFLAQQACQQVVVMPDTGKSLLIGGTLNGRPMLCRWAGTADATVGTSGNTGQLAWIRNFDGSDGSTALQKDDTVPAPGIEFLEYNAAGQGVISLMARDPKNRLVVPFTADPTSGNLTFLGTTIPTFGLFAAPGDARVDLRWDAVSGAVAYRIHVKVGAWQSSFATTEPHYAYLNADNGYLHQFWFTWEDAQGTISSPSAEVTATPTKGPVASLTSPLAGRLPAAGSVNLVAIATAAGSAITKVEFLANGESIGYDFTAPYELPWTPGNGGFELKAAIIDASGTRRVSDGVWVARGPIHSTTTGGYWQEPTTWVGRVIPVDGDDIVVNGPVSGPGFVSGTNDPIPVACNALDVAAAGTLEVSGILSVQGDLTNRGIVKPSPGARLNVHGLLHNLNTVNFSNAGVNLEISQITLSGGLNNQGAYYAWTRLASTSVPVITLGEGKRIDGRLYLEKPSDAVKVSSTLGLNQIALELPENSLGDFTFDLQGNDLKLEDGAISCYEQVTYPTVYRSCRFKNVNRVIASDSWTWRPSAEAGFFIEGAGDGVTLVGTHTVSGKLTVTTSLTLAADSTIRTDGSGNHGTMVVKGNFTNLGTVTDYMGTNLGGYNVLAWLDFQLGGNLVQGNFFRPSNLVLNGSTQTVTTQSGLPMFTIGDKRTENDLLNRITFQTQNGTLKLEHDMAIPFLEVFSIATPSVGLSVIDAQGYALTLEKRLCASGPLEIQNVGNLVASGVVELAGTLDEALPHLVFRPSTTLTGKYWMTGFIDFYGNAVQAKDGKWSTFQNPCTLRTLGDGSQFVPGDGGKVYNGFYAQWGAIQPFKINEGLITVANPATTAAEY